MYGNLNNSIIVLLVVTSKVYGNSHSEYAEINSKYPHTAVVSHVACIITTSVNQIIISMWFEIDEACLRTLLFLTQVTLVSCLPTTAAIGDFMCNR